MFVDGAHAFAHFPFTRDDLDCDYYGTSLHKWLQAPIGTGFLYVRRDKIKSLWPLMAAARGAWTTNIRKYEEIGTHPAANHNAISVALTFHRGIGAERKAARLRYLRDRWAVPLQAASDRVKVLTPLNSHAAADRVRHRRRPRSAKLQAWLLEPASHRHDAIVHPSSAASGSRRTSTRPPRRSTPSPPRF